ncbi:hypothetical protein [Sphingobium sp.]|uniref:hypothetical protein n=1 Tax=Sphingobium sp. TaxID=1912891 RepID=UPI003B3ABCD8
MGDDGIDGVRALLPKALGRLPREVRLRGQNSLEGFRKAKELLNVDREMASFRAITAEEEAASALFVSLKRQGYDGADKINLKDHYTKAALGPFIQAVAHSLSHDEKFNISLSINASEPSIEVAIPVDQFGGPDDIIIKLEHPLGMLRKVGDLPASDLYDKSLEYVSGSRKLHKLIASEANARNRLLYASDSNLPSSKVTIEGINQRQKRAEIALFACIAVLQTNHKQAMATQCIAAFLKVIDKGARKGCQI